MPLYQYVKASPKNSNKRNKRKSPVALLVPFVFMGLGGGILLWALWPIISFTVFTAPLFQNTVSPVNESASAVALAKNPGGALSPLVLAADGSNKDSSGDYTNANTWFPSKPQKKIVAPVNTYKISIPKLKIENANVIIGGDDLNKSLIHYGGTGLPGEYGTTVVFGHSVLPQFFNPKDYRTIFSTLPTIKVGDEIFVNYDGVDYRYIVIDMVITDPGDLTVLEQRFDDSYLTLITCVPPGTYWKRLSVKAKLVRFSS